MMKWNEIAAALGPVQPQSNRIHPSHLLSPSKGRKLAEGNCSVFVFQGRKFAMFCNKLFVCLGGERS